MNFQVFHVNPGKKLKKKDVNNNLSHFMSVFPNIYAIIITSSIKYIPSLYDFVNKFYGTISIYYLLWFMKPIYIFVPPSWWHVLQYKEHSDKTKLQAHFGKLSS